MITAGTATLGPIVAFSAIFWALVFRWAWATDTSHLPNSADVADDLATVDAALLEALNLREGITDQDVERRAETNIEDGSP